jgi:hypothetical protein
MLLKAAGLAVLVGALSVFIARLEARRPIVELERAGATVVVDFDGLVRSVSFSDVSADDRHLKFIAQLETVTSITLSRSRITADGIRLLASLPQLRSLDISETPAAGGSLAVLCEFPALRTLQMRRCPWINDAELAAIQGESRLENLMLLDAEVTAEGLAHLHHFSQLRQLGLDECDGVTDDGLRQLLQLTQLQELSLDRCDRVTARGLAQLAAMEDLQQLSVRGVPILRRDVRRLVVQFPRTAVYVDDITIPEVQPLLELGARLGLDEDYEVVWIELDSRADDAGIVPPLATTSPPGTVGREEEPARFVVADVDDDALARLSLTPEIDTLFLREIPITDAGLKHLQSLSNLQWLVLDGVPLSDEGILAFAELPMLQRLWLRHVHLQGRELGRLRSAECLTELALYSDSLTTDGVAQLPQLTHLQSLVIGSALPPGSGRHLAAIPDLQELAIVRADVSLEDLRDLSQAPRLARLQFIESRLAPRALAQLQPMNSLASLHLGQCEFEPLELNALLARRPDLAVSGVPDQFREAPLEFPEQRQLLSGIPLLGPRAPTAVH